MKRFSADRIKNNFCKSLLDLCSTMNIHFMNGRCGSDSEVGDYTYIGNRGTSLIDYVISSSRWFELVYDFNVQLAKSMIFSKLTLNQTILCVA